MKRLKFFALALALTMLASFVFAQKSPVIKGSVLNNKYSEVTLKLAYGSNPKTFGKATINSDGSFELKSTVDVPDIYSLSFSANENFIIPLYLNQNIEITIDADDLRAIPSVKGSESLTFAKQAIDILGNANTLLDSINMALQNDKQQQFYYAFTQNFNSFYQTNIDVNAYVTKSISIIDSLKAKTDMYAEGGKINPKNLEDYSYYCNNLLRELGNTYSPIENFMRNAYMLYDFKTHRINGNEKFFAKLDNFLKQMEDNHQTAASTIGVFAEKANDLVAERDSLVFANAFDKKKEKSAWCAKVAQLVKEKYALVSNIKTSLTQSIAQSDAQGKEIYGQVQNIVSGIVQQYQMAYNEATDRNNQVLKDLLLQNKDDLAVLMFIDAFPREKNVALHSEIVKALHAVLPDNTLVKERYAIETSPATSTAVGSIAPELAFSDPEGNIRKLSDLRGKVVLIDFWASWCRPCRNENPHVVAMYKKYHDQGFEVFSVSLDRDKNSWVNAIKADGLIWPNHVSDLKYWQSEGAKIYGVSSIPCTFLIDQEGRILARGLRGDDLSRTLKKIFGN